MKFLYTAFIALAVLAFAGCGGATKETLPATQNAPKFENAAANDFVKAYGDAVNEVATAYKSKDAAKISAASTKMSEALTKSAAAVKDLKPEEATKLNEWISTLGTQLAEAATKAAK